MYKSRVRDIPVAAAVAENAEIAEEEANISPVCPNAPNKMEVGDTFCASELLSSTES